MVTGGGWETTARVEWELARFLPRVSFIIFLR